MAECVCALMCVMKPAAPLGRLQVQLPVYCCTANVSDVLGEGGPQRRERDTAYHFSLTLFYSHASTFLSQSLLC